MMHACPWVSGVGVKVYSTLARYLQISSGKEQRQKRWRRDASPSEDFGGHLVRLGKALRTHSSLLATLITPHDTRHPRIQLGAV